MDNKKISARELTLTAMTAALVFLATYTLKIPTPTGYAHLGDCVIFIGVLVLGSKKGALAGGIGAALSDALGGYTHWIVPTFFIKAAMALIMGAFVYKLLKSNRFAWLVGAFVGGLIQVLLYALVKIPMYGLEYVTVTLWSDIVQTLFGIGISAFVIAALQGGGIIKKLRLSTAA